VKTQSWQLEAASYPFSIRFNPHYSHLDTERHVNNVAVQSFHTESRTRFHMALLGETSWYSDAVLLRPRRTVTHFLRETHYPHEVTATVRVVAVDNDRYRLVQALFQHDQCVGVQECLMGAWHQGDWVALPDNVQETLRGEVGEPPSLLPWPDLNENDAGIRRYPQKVSLKPRYADLDPDRCLAELAAARYMEQSRAGSLNMLRLPGLGLLVARIDIRYLRWDAGIGDVALHSGLAGIGNTSFVLRGGARVDDTLVAVSESVMVLMDREARRPTPVTGPLRDAMAELIVDGA